MNLPALALPRRLRRTRPEARHTAAALAAPEREQPLASTAPPPAPQVVPSDETVTFSPPASCVYPLDEYPDLRQGIWAAPTPELLRDLADGLRNLPDVPAGAAGAESGPDADLLPATLLRTIPRDGDEGDTRKLLSGMPEFAGVHPSGTGIALAALCVGTDKRHIPVRLENGDREYWRRLALEALRAHLAGLKGIVRARAWDEFLGDVTAMRDAQAYGGFRVTPPAPHALAPLAVAPETANAPAVPAGTISSGGAR